jgi:hypothetical protein
LHGLACPILGPIFDLRVSARPLFITLSFRSNDFIRVCLRLLSDKRPGQVKENVKKVEENVKKVQENVNEVK